MEGGALNIAYLLHESAKTHPDKPALFIVDRKKDLIIRGGYNVYPNARRRRFEGVIRSSPDR